MIHTIISPEEAGDITAEVRKTTQFSIGYMWVGEKQAFAFNLPIKMNRESYEIIGGLDEKIQKALDVAPENMTPGRFNVYTGGSYYKTHVDAPVIQGICTDKAFTLFLSDPSSYDGGELLIHRKAGSCAYKLAAGQAIVYPCRWPHEVTTVTRGFRLAMIGWFQNPL